VLIQLRAQFDATNCAQTATDSAVVEKKILTLLNVIYNVSMANKKRADESQASNDAFAICIL